MREGDDAMAMDRRNSHRLDLSTGAATTLLLGWLAASLAAFAVADARGVLDLPVGALFAGQGALIGLVLVGVRFSHRR